MPIQDTLLFFSLLLAAALLAEPLAKKLHLPFPALLMLTGFLGSEALVSAGFDTGIRFDSFHDLILYVLLPLLVFAGAIAIDRTELKRNLLPIAFLTIPATLMSISLTSMVIYFGIGHPSGFPWTAALLTGALLAATDPLAILAHFQNRPILSRLGLILEGEGLFNDAATIVIFALCLQLALQPTAMIDPADTLKNLAIIFFGGLSIGALTGLIFLALARILHYERQRFLITLIGAYGAYLSAEIWLDVSGVMAVLACGLVLSGALRHPDKDKRGHDEFVLQAWELLAYIASALVFLLMGLTITLSMFEERWLAMLIGIAGVLCARAFSVYTGFPILGLLPGIDRFPVIQQSLLIGGGLRGAVTLALALSLPLELSYWWTVQSIAFGVVVFSLFIQAPALPLMIRRADKSE